MEFRTPKELEKKPVVFGIPLGVVVISLFAVALVSVMAFKNKLLSALFFMLYIGYIYLYKKFPRGGELMEYIRNSITNQYILFDQPIDQIVNPQLKEKAKKLNTQEKAEIDKKITFLKNENQSKKTKSISE